MKRCSTSSSLAAGPRRRPLVGCCDARRRGVRRGRGGRAVRSSRSSRRRRAAAATAVVRSAWVNVDRSAVRSRRSRSAIHSSGVTVRSHVSTLPCSSKPTVSSRHDVVDVDRVAAHARRRRALRPWPVPSRVLRLRPSSRRRSVRVHARACCGGSPAPPPVGLRACWACRSPPARRRSRRTASRTRRGASWGMPAISGTCRPGRHSTPRRRVSSSRNDGLEHLAGGAGVPVDLGMHERGPPPVGALDEVGDEDVPVQQRVTRPARCDAGTTPRPHRSWPAAADRRLARSCSVEAGEVGEVVRAALHPDRLALQPADRGSHRRLAGFDHRALDPRIVGHGVEHAGRLRGLERQIEARAPGVDAAAACHRSESAHRCRGEARRARHADRPGRPARRGRGGSAPPPTHWPWASPAPV